MQYLRLMDVNKTVFHISGMDCSAEEQMVRMRLGDEPYIHRLDFDLSKRLLTVYHQGFLSDIESKIGSLNLGKTVVQSSTTEESFGRDLHNDTKLLWYVLFINAFCFILELGAGFIANSMGLIADSLDMLADTLVYSLSLYAIGRTVSKQKQVAKVSGYLQMVLAVTGLVEVIRRFLGFESLPDFRLMIAISVIALIGNTLSLWLLQKSKGKGVHIQASVIFTSNDIIINFGVILAALIVLFTKSSLPDLIVGSVVFLIVLRGARRILSLSK